MTEFNYSAYGVTSTVQQAQEEAAQNGGGGNFDTMPQHNNQLIIEEMDISQNASTGSVNLKVVSCIVGDQFNGRKMWNNFNLVTKKGDLNQITKYQLSDLAAAVGFPTDQVLNNPLDLMNYQNPFNAQVKIEKGGKKDDGTFYDDKNVFANPKAMGGTAPAPRQAQPKAQPQQGFQQPAQQGFQQPAQGGFQQPQFKK
tara:strand:+ start:51092 stop:51685 length:594 start_codon:yes stop_codon:yes gene_type:complete